MDNIQPFLFWTLAGVTGACAVAVVASQNIVRAATWLLFALGGVSGLFFLLGADFVGATQLLVYVGGTLVLVIFGVMLTAQGPFINIRISAAEWAISGIVGLALMGVLTVSALAAGRGVKPRTASDPARSQSADTLGLTFLGLGYGPAQTPNQKGARSARGASTVGLAGAPQGQGPLLAVAALPTAEKVEKVPVRRTHYFLPFLIVSVHLLVVLIGAAYLARAKRRRPPHGLTTEAPLLNRGATP